MQNDLDGQIANESMKENLKRRIEVMENLHKQQIADLTEQATKAASCLQLRLDAIIDANAQLIKTNAQLVEINAALTDQLLSGIAYSEGYIKPLSDLLED